MTLGRPDAVAPDVDPVVSHEHGHRVRVPVDGLAETLFEVLLEVGVVDDRDHQLAVVLVAGNGLDLLDVGDPELRVEHLRDQDRPLRVRVDARTRCALCVRGHEQRRARAGLVLLRLLQILSGRVVHHEQVHWLHALLVHSGRGQVHQIVLFDGNAASRAGDPVSVVEKTAQLADEVGRVFCVLGHSQTVLAHLF